MTTRIVVIGGGQLGSQFLHDYADHDIVGFNYPDFDITNPDHDAKITEFKPQIILNCAAYTNVDKAESEPELCRAVNATAPGRLAKLAKTLDALFVHVSTDFVFDGTKNSPYREDDPTNPLNVYGQTKLEGEQLVEASGARYLTARTAWLNGGSGPNFILKMLELAQTKPELTIVADQVGSPTFTRDLARGIMALVEQGQTGLFHVVNQGQASRYELVEELLKLAKISIPLRQAVTADFPTPAARPLYSVLSIDKLTKFHRMRPWKVALADYLEEISRAS